MSDYAQGTQIQVSSNTMFHCTNSLTKLRSNYIKKTVNKDTGTMGIWDRVIEKWGNLCCRPQTLPGITLSLLFVEVSSQLKVPKCFFFYLIAIRMLDQTQTWIRVDIKGAKNIPNWTVTRLLTCSIPNPPQPWAFCVQACRRFPAKFCYSGTFTPPSRLFSLRLCQFFVSWDRTYLDLWRYLPNQ